MNFLERIKNALEYYRTLKEQVATLTAQKASDAEHIVTLEALVVELHNVIADKDIRIDELGQIIDEHQSTLEQAALLVEETLQVEE